MASIKLVLVNKNAVNKYNISVQILSNRTKAILKTNYYVEKNQFKEGRVRNHPNSTLMNKRLSSILSDYEQKLDKIYVEQTKMTAKEIKEYLLNVYVEEVRKKEDVELFSYLEEYIADLDRKYKALLLVDKKASKGTWKNYSILYNSLRRFKGDQRVLFKDINKRWLEDYEQFLRESGVNTGIWSYMKSLKHLFNSLINSEDQRLSAECYPFRYYSIAKFKGNSTPQFLNIEEVRSVMHYETTNDTEIFARDTFILNYLLMGFNFKDMYFLEKEDIQDGRVHYTRSKTGVKHSVKIEPEHLEYFERLKGEKELFCFQEKYSSRAVCSKMISKGLRRICANLNIPAFAIGRSRYTWSTIAFNDLNINETVIDLALAHKVSHTLAGAYYIVKKVKLMDDANRQMIDYLFETGPFEKASE